MGTSETLQQQSDIVTTATSKSKVMQWGDLSFQSDKVSEFQGDKASLGNSSPSKQGQTMSAREVDLKQAYDNYSRATSSKERLAAGEELQQVIADQLEVEAAFSRFLEILYPGD